MAPPQKYLKKNYIWFSNPNSGYPSKRIEIKVSKRYLRAHVHYSVIHNGHDMKTIQMAVDCERLRKTWFVHVIEYYSSFKKKELLHGGASHRRKDTVWFHLYEESESQTH